ncbi:MAG: T9SS type A sorting domain-containing protein [Bacteroidetes bacterium]|nr:MAG: T9SS type A sorting domain-containing protein [Bacteroidota bacterium]
MVAGISINNPDRTDALVFPNPFTDVMQVDFQLPQAAMVRIELMDVNGRTVKLFLEDRIKAGTNRLSFNAAYLSSGTYFLRGSGERGEILFSEQLIKQ